MCAYPLMSFYLLMIILQPALHNVNMILKENVFLWGCYQLEKHNELTR